MFEDKEKKSMVAKQQVQRDMNSQKQNFKQRLAMRKKKQQLRQSGIFEQDMNMSEMMRRIPQSTRASGPMPRFNAQNFSISIANEMAELEAQEQAESGEAVINPRKNEPLTPLMGKSTGLLAKQSVSTRASNPIGSINFHDNINDISNIYQQDNQDVSNVLSANSFDLTINDAFKYHHGDQNNSGKMRKQTSNTCKHLGLLLSNNYNPDRGFLFHLNSKREWSWLGGDQGSVAEWCRWILARVARRDRGRSLLQQNHFSL